MTRILLVHPGAIGDTLVALPVLDALKRRYHQAHLCMIGHPGLLELLPGRSAVDEMRSIDGRDFTELLAGVESLSDACRTFYRRFDLAIVWVDDHDGRIRQSLQSLDISRVTVQSPELRKLGKESAAERLKGTLSELEGVEFGVGPSLRMTESDKAEGAAWLVRHGISPDASQVVAVHPGSGSPSKCWPAERYAEVITRLLGDEIQIVLIGGPADREVIARVEQHLGRQVSRLAGAELSTVAAVLSQCHAFFGNDSGVMHVASALGLPAVAIFGSSDPKVWAIGTSVIPFRGDDPVQTVLDTVRQALSRPVRTLLTPPSLC